MALGKRAWRLRKGAWCGAMLKLARGNTKIALSGARDFNMTKRQQIQSKLEKCIILAVYMI